MEVVKVEEVEIIRLPAIEAHLTASTFSTFSLLLSQW